MDESADNIAYFNTLVGLIFGQLYREFPIQTRINTDDIAIAMGVEGYATSDTIVPGVKIVSDWGMLSQTSFWQLYEGTLAWLKEEGFVRELTHEEWVLSASALATLSLRPAALDAPLGKKLGDAARGAGTEAGRAAIAELVGQFIGAVAKGIFT